MKLYGDLETYSSVPIKHGTHVYAAQAEILLFAYALDDGPVNVWDLTRKDPMPSDLEQAWHDPTVEVVFHNSAFDRTVIKATGLYTPPIERWRDTMVKAYAHSLPGSLADLCDVLKVPADKVKDTRGKQLIQLFCKPRPKNHKLRRATRDTHPQEWDLFIDYAKSDIEAMREADKRLPDWNYRGAELALWHLDQRINDRGVAIDLDLVHAAIRTVDKEQERLKSVTQDMTNGAVQAATQRDALMYHIFETYGIDLPDLTGSTVERAIDEAGLPPELRELLIVRLQASTSSTAKYKKLAQGTSADGRLRGTLQFCGATRTGRWAGRLFQPQNLPRPALENEEIETGIEAMKLDAADLITENVMELTSSAIRGCIVAPPGKKLVVADLSNIEGRMLAWLAGEEWKLAAYERGEDLYISAYAKSFNVAPETVTKAQRQIGKVQELALGYQGRVGAFLTFAGVYGIDLEKMAHDAWDAIPDDVKDQAKDFYDWSMKNKGKDFGLSEKAYLVCESFVRLWRDAHKNVASYWKELENVCIYAVENPGETLTCRKHKIRRDNAWLRISLPSGRYLCYPHPKVENNKLSYMGINQYSRKWSRLNTYGGKLVENITQAAARDVLACSMPIIEAKGYEIVLTVHDEIISEATDKPEFNSDDLAAIMSTVPAWAKGLPLAAAGFEAYRYKKD